MENRLNSNDISVVISSCDHFSDCWEALAISLKQFWPDCPFQMYLITNHRGSDQDQFQACPTGDDRGWASNLKKALESLDSEFVVYLQEDYWLDRPVSTAAIGRHLNFCRTHGYDYLRLTFPEYDKGSSGEDRYCQIPAGIRYRLCLQAALWRRSKLLEILEDGWTGWDFERNIESLLERKNILVKSAVLHSSKRPGESIEYVDGTGIRKGRWTRAGAAYLRRNGLCELLPRRRVEGVFLNFAMHLKLPGTRLAARAAVWGMNRLKWNF